MANAEHGLQMLRKLTAASCLLSLPLYASTENSGMPGFNVSEAMFNYTDGMDLQDGDGSLNTTTFEIRTLLSKPLNPATGLTIIPQFRYDLTSLDFDGVTPPPLGLRDEELHTLSLSVFALKRDDASPWVYGGFANVDLASDFQHIDEDDFTFDVAGGVGYRFSDSFTLGAGAAVINLNGDMMVFPGINFDWKVSEKLRVGQYGPVFVAAYTPDNDWLISVRGDPAGGVWNITDEGGESRSIDLSSYQLGLYVSRRITGQLWMTAGAGATFGNEIRLSDPDGDNFSAEDLETGLFGQVGLRLKAW